VLSVETEADRRHGGDTQVTAFPLPQTPREGPERIERIVRTFGLLEEDPGLGGRHESSALALEQANAKPGLRLLNGGGHRRLGHAEAACRLGDGAACHHGEKHFHVPEIQALSTPCCKIDYRLGLYFMKIF
jgi:hypothetical protein